MPKLTRIFASLLLLATTLLLVTPARAQDDAPPPAPIENDEGGPVIIDGEMNYTNPETFSNIAQPLIVLEDQTGFIDRNRGYVLPPASQALGVITGDFFSPPFTWTLSLPSVPQGTLRDVDQNGKEDKGVMTYAVAFWSNSFGDPYLERRDLSGGGWSTGYATTRVKTNPSGGGEVTGGKYVVWAPDDQQGFPSGFGADGKLFTADDPIVGLPAGYTIVNLDSDPFTFDRSRLPTMELIEPEDSALDDFSDLSYTEAFDKMVAMFREQYAFTELKHIDWDAMNAEFRPLFAEAEKNDDVQAYRQALRDFMLAIPDAHIKAPMIREDFARDTGGGLGMAIREVDDGQTIVNFITPDGPADKAGIEVGAEIVSFDGQPIADYVSAVQPYSAPFGTEHTKRLQQLRYATRAPLDTELEVAYRNPDNSELAKVKLTAVAEDASFRSSSFNRGLTGAELPVEFKVLDNGIGYAKVNSFFDNELLTVQLWEQMIHSLNTMGVPGLVLDLRQNGGGSGFLSDQLAAYFFNDELVVGNTEFYDKELGKFAADPNTVQRFILPDPSLQYSGNLAVIVGPNCASACEFFTYDMTKQNRAEIIGQYPTAGAGGSRVMFIMPGPEALLLPVGRPLDADGNIVVEGMGVAPTVRLPVTEETLFYDGDAMLETAIASVTGQDLPFGAVPITKPDAEAATMPEVTVMDQVTTTVEVTATEAAPVEQPTATAAMTATATITVPETATVMGTPEAPAAETPMAGEAITTTESVTETATVEPTAMETPAAKPTPKATRPAAGNQSVTIVAPAGRALVYAQPIGTSGVLGFVKNGEVFDLLEQSANGQWVRINYTGAEQGGWVNIKYAQIN